MHRYLRQVHLPVLALVVSIFVLVAASAALATPPGTVFVRTDGSNANCDGTANVAYPGSGSGLACALQTIQAGVTAVASGGTVNVAAGTYAGVVSVTRNVSLLGAQAGIAGSSHSGAESVVSAFNVSNANVTVDGFTFNPGASNSGVALSFQGGSAETVQNNVISGYGYDTATSHGTEAVSFAGTSGMLFQHNRLTGPTPTGQARDSAQAAQDGIFAGSGVSNNTQILNNVFEQASTYPGTDIGLSYTSGANPVISGNVSTSGATFVTLFNSTGAQITGNSFTADPNVIDTGSLVYIGGGDTNTTVSGNTLSGGYYGVALRNNYGDGTSGATTITANTLTNNYGGGIGVASGSIGSSETVVAHENIISGNVVGISNTSTGTINATRNYWGTTLGATIASEITGTGVVTYSPYYVSSTGALDATGTLSNVANLTALSLSSGTLTPAFTPSTTAYTATVDTSVTNVTVSESTVPGASALVTGGSSLDVGDNTITVTVTSADGAVATYTVVVNRAAPTPAPAPTTTTTTTTTTPQINQPSEPTPATPDQAGSVTVLVGPAATTSSAPGVVNIATLAKPVAAVTVGASWPAGTFTTPVTVQMTPMPELASPLTTGGGTTPSPIAGGFSIGNTVFQLTVISSDTGSAVTSFQAPIVFHVSALGIGEVPAYSHDGTTWTTIPRLDSPGLPAGQPDGYYVNADRSADISTRHATFFGLLKDTQAPSTPKLKIRVEKTSLRLSVSGASDNIGVAGYVISRNGNGYKATKATSIVLPLKLGTYVVRARDTSGNTSRPSKEITIVRGVHQPFELKS